MVSFDKLAGVLPAGLLWHGCPAFSLVVLDILLPDGDGIELLKEIRGAVDVDTTFVAGNPELVAVPNRRKAADLGVNVLDIGLASQLLIGGVKVSRYEDQGREYDILVRADESFRSSPEALAQLTVPSAKLGTVPLLKKSEPKPTCDGLMCLVILRVIVKDAKISPPF